MYTVTHSTDGKILTFDIDIQDIRGAGKRYEDTYGEYLKFFEHVALTPKDIRVKIFGAPYSWVPLLQYLSCSAYSPQIVFEHDWMLARILSDEDPTVLNRTAVENLCGFRPETADALWKCDMQWKTDRVVHEHLREFIVTNNGSFHRKEVLDFRRALSNYTPVKDRVVLVPCAADKPYPAPMHQAVLDRLPGSYYMMNATGVLGLVPTDLWPVMPYYDSGIPNEWRLFQTVKEYFGRNNHEKIVVYCDFYSQAIYEGLKSVDQLYKTTFINPVQFYSDYLDLLDPERLNSLERAL